MSRRVTVDATDLNRLLNYLLDDEKRHYIEGGCQANHIYHSVARLLEQIKKNRSRCAEPQHVDA